MTLALEAAVAVGPAAARRRAQRELMWRDHGLLRVVFSNFHWIAPGMARANQPSPRQLAAYKAQGFRTILNLRGVSDRGHYLLEREACDQLGLTLIDLPVTAREPPSRAQILAARALFSSLAQPCLMHCKSGSDRTGLMGVLYRHFQEGAPIAAALEQLSPKYLHVRHGRAGIIDAFFERYLEETAQTGKPFIDWVVEDYDAQALADAYRPGVWLRGLIDLVMNREMAPAAGPA